MAWRNYRKGKRSKKDVQEFEFRLEDNVFQLREDLLSGTYRPGQYQQFLITDPKTRTISKALVRDRLLHQAIYQKLYSDFDRTFITDSYSCRDNKGTHRAFRQLTKYARQVSRNYHGPCWAIKMDIRKFFDSIDHEILLRRLNNRISDPNLLYLLKQIVGSFEFSRGKGMPLGNLTSQLFANIYMDPLDKFVKHQLKAEYYLRYADDFLILSSDPDKMLGYLVEINCFLKESLKLQLHPNKITLRKLAWGIDFVGYVALPHYNLPRQKTICRIVRQIERSDPEKLVKFWSSYLGYLQHAASHHLRNRLLQVLGDSFGR